MRGDVLNMAEIIDGKAVAQDIRDGLSNAVKELEEEGVTPCLATVLMSDDPAAEKYVSMKQNDCEEVGIATRDPEITAEDSAEDLYNLIEELNNDPEVHGILVQLPLPDHVEEQPVIDQINPQKDVDGFHPENVGKLVIGNPRFKPCTPHGVQMLLDAYDIETEGKDAVVVGRSNIVGKPMANIFIQKADGGNATTTVCHSRTQDLESKVKQADILVAAAGVAEFIDGSMISEDTIVIDVGTNSVERDGERTLVGDVEFESAERKASAITPVPGGVGPMTRAMLLYNTVKAAALQNDVDVSLPKQ